MIIPRSKLRVPRAVISAFVLFYVGCLWVWLQPNSVWRDNVLTPVKPLIMFLGLWQNYQVFSPDPRLVNVFLDAEVTYADGTTSIWKYPRMEQFGPVEKMVKERYRKLGLDYLNWDVNKKLWPEFALYVARQDRLAHGGTPVKVKLRRHFARIPAPEVGLSSAARPEAEKMFVFFEYQVAAQESK